MDKSRLEAFSDGVLAVAITLLALDISVPDARHGRLGHALLAQWPEYLAFLTSFLTIGIIWINHHAAIRRLREVDHTILTLNLLLLMSVCALPFTTSLMAAYLKRSSGENFAAAIYSGSFLLMGVLFLAFNRHILLQKPHLLRPSLAEHQRRDLLRRSVAGLVPYAIATATAVISPYVTLAICTAVAGYYAFPSTTASGGDSESEQSPPHEAAVRSHRDPVELDDSCR
jgi:uncharacterized membrane protein